MKTHVLSALLASLLLPAAGPAAQAHHAFAAEFDGHKPVTLNGVVTRLQWSNPHSWLYIEVKDEQGRVTEWAVEFGAPYALLQKGLRKTDFPLGTPVQVEGFLARSGASVANASSVTLEDGRGFYTAASDSPAQRQLVKEQP